jgi:hypothetical protein
MRKNAWTGSAMKKSARAIVRGLAASRWGSGAGMVSGGEEQVESTVEIDEWGIGGGREEWRMVERREAWMEPTAPERPGRARQLRSVFPSEHVRGMKTNQSWRRRESHIPRTD